MGEWSPVFEKERSVQMTLSRQTVLIKLSEAPLVVLYLFRLYWSPEEWLAFQNPILDWLRMVSYAFDFARKGPSGTPPLQQQIHLKKLHDFFVAEYYYVCFGEGNGFASNF